MGIISGLLGNASKIDAAKVQEEYAAFLTQGETVDHAYKLVRDLLIFTSKRFIWIDKQGLTGHKTQYHSIPYDRIVQFSVETAGHLDLDAELKIWVTGMGPHPIIFKFNKQLSIYEVERELADHVLN